MKKVLIWDYFPLKNIGGPAGYSFNIHEYLREHPTSQVSFLSDIVKENAVNVEFDYPQFPQKQYNSRIGQLWQQLYRIYFFCFKPFLIKPNDVPLNIDINIYDYIHVHMVPHVSQVKRLFPRYRGKILLTTHCPCTWTEENMGHVARTESKLYRFLRTLKPLILSLENHAYESADYIIFPCKGAKEPYEKEPHIKHTFEKHSKKFLYIPTAIIDYHSDVKTMQRFYDFDIPKDAFVITYFGRHIPIKGYDILSSLGIKLLNKYPNLYFLCAGNGPIEPPQHPRWIELGFINNVDDLLPQGSLYVLPNRETYFDLITLQILRAGVPLVLSTTGGNKFFEELPLVETKGMTFFDINDEKQLETIVEQLIHLKSDNPKEYEKMRQSNRKLFERYFTLDKYISKYIESINALP